MSIGRSAYRHFPKERGHVFGLFRNHCFVIRRKGFPSSVHLCADTFTDAPILSNDMWLPWSSKGKVEPLTLYPFFFIVPVMKEHALTSYVVVDRQDERDTYGT